jgi:type VI secretion system protein
MRKLAVVLLPCLALAGCSLLHKGTPRTRIRSVEVIAQQDANRSSATAIDVVFVYAGGAVPLLPTTGPAWFQQKAGLMNALGGGVEVVSLEVPPPYRLVQLAMPRHARRAIRVLAYANYLGAAGQAPIDLTAYRRVTLHLLENRIECTCE